VTSAHPPREHNPHVWQYLDGNTVTSHITDGTPATPVDADGNPVEGGEQQWQDKTPETDPAGTDSSTSSSTAETPSKSPEPSSPKPAPTTEHPSESDQTTKSTAPSTDGDGTAPKTAPSRRSAAKSK
jgi:hypothetical protein